ncbi:MAG: complex I subunit 1 family protein [Thermonemataceae bacterium]|nr:complex I subunit 1 family protein [Thermonemataceae bacterium]
MLAILNFIYYLSFTLILVLITFYAERKLAAFIQDRMGPTEVGKYGLLQPFADLLKLLQKEDIVPAGADKKLFLLAPIVIFPAVFAAISVIPLSPRLQGASLEIGIFVLLAIVALDVVGLLMAGWGSHNKYALYGAMRSVAQMVSYEVPLTLSVLSVVVLSQSMDLREIALSQGIYTENDSYFWGIKSLNVKEIGGFLSWNIFKVPFLWLAYIIFFIATLAESNRAPFDLPEGESELVGGFHTEYSGFRFAIFFLAEYTMMILVSLLGIILFWGAWNTPFPNIAGFRLATWTTGEAGSLAEGFWAIFWLSSKTVLVLFLQVIIRWTYPRLRIDQLMYLAWKVLTPIALLILLLSAVWRVI